MLLRFMGIIFFLGAIGFLATGCSKKFTECNQATTLEECKKENFVEGEFQCKWEPGQYKEKGKCVEITY